MADLLRSTTSTQAPLLDTRTPRVSSSVDKTSAVLGQLATLGAKGTQIYLAEHEKNMERKAKNDLVNRTINPDLQMHEGAYAVTVAKGTALRSFDAMKAEIEEGKWNHLSPEEFQQQLTARHAEYKGELTSKYRDLEAEAYDDVWLKNEATLTAGHAGMYRKQLQEDQGQALLAHMDTLSQNPDVTADDFIDAGTQPEYSLLSDDDVINMTMVAGIRSGSVDVMQKLDDKFHFSVDPARSKMFNAALQAAQKEQRAINEEQAVQTLKTLYTAAEEGDLTEPLVVAATKTLGPDSKPLITPKEGAKLLARATGNRIKNQSINQFRSKFAKDIDISDATDKDKQKLVTEFITGLKQQNVPMDDIVRQLGSKATLLGSTKIDYMTSVVNQVGQFDLESLNDEASAKEFYDMFNQTRVFVGALGETNPMVDAYLGKHSGRYHKLAEYFDISGGDNISKLRSAAKLTRNWEKQAASGVPFQETKDWDTTDAAENWVDSKKGFWSDVFSIEDESDQGGIQMFDALVKKLGKEQGLSQPAAEKAAERMMNSSRTFFGGRWQGMGANELKAKLGNNPEVVYQKFMSNPLWTTALDKALGERPDGELRDTTDYNLLLNEAGTSIIITSNEDPSKSAVLPVDAFVQGASYKETDAEGFVNLDKIWEADTPEAKEFRNLSVADADQWFQYHGINKPRRQTYLSEVVIGPDGVSVKEPEVIPSLAEWSKMPAKDRVELHQAWLNLNFNGSMTWFDKSWEFVSGTAASPAQDIPRVPQLSAAYGEGYESPAKDAYLKALGTVKKFFGFDPKDPAVETSPMTFDDVASVTVQKGRGAKNNNPGNLKASSLANGNVDGFSTFETPEIGFKALVRQVGLDSDRGDTLESFIKDYAPKTENDTGTYLKFLMKEMGASEDTKLSDMDHVKLAEKIAKFESQTIVKYKD